ncbi:hypothetical protein BDY17DRAFT_344603 [Neohortaea acidophila]|uniref:GDSL lipase/esterase n=1 Tax=Neohortaea acidophila TaxID=245834 RepID=A0A6A6Q023_9PEZI|nr:uncharacterized protein BDY17DRAFT_344603 [Neohortaea acidophila]KAF2485818.1 hypothetical protein BDY17DRAFT_344603 [Neohortaea acidophila]
MWTLSSTGFASLLAVQALYFSSAAARTTKKKPSTSKYPFNELVVFGDQLSDNGNGSYAHGLDPNNIYGYYTWTDGPVAPTYLAELLNVPLQDYAWGGSYGGGLAGSTIDNSYTPAKDLYKGKPVPSTYDQIFSNYTAKGKPANIENALQFMWIGQNDLKKHTNWYVKPPTLITPDAKPNVAFYNNFTTLLLQQIEHLIETGAPAVMYVNLFPIQTAPITAGFLCHNNTVCADNWGTVIEAANNFTQNALANSQYADKIIYYDVYSFMIDIMNNKNQYGYTEPLYFLCDSGNQSNPVDHFKECAVPPKWTHARPFFWFTNDQPETTMHQMIAQDMLKTIDTFFKVDSS